MWRERTILSVRRGEKSLGQMRRDEKRKVSQMVGMCVEGMRERDLSHLFSHDFFNFDALPSLQGLEQCLESLERTGQVKHYIHQPYFFSEAKP